MRITITIAIAVLLSFITSASVSGADKSKDIQKASDLLAKSRSVVALDNEASFRMEATLQAVDESGHAEDGTYKIIWATRDRFREETVLGAFQQTRVIKGGQEWRKRSLTYLPLRVIQLRDLLPTSPNFAVVRLDKDVVIKEQNEKSIKLLCIKSESGPRNSTICIDEQTAEPVYIEIQSRKSSQRVRMEFHDYAPFGHGRQIPRTILYSVNGATALEVRIVKIEMLASDAMDLNAALTPMPGVQPTSFCASVQGAEGPGITSPFAYDTMAGPHYLGFGMIGADGKLRNLLTVRSIDEKTDVAAAKLLNNGPYTPARCKGSAIDRELLFLLSSDAISLESAPEAGNAGYSRPRCIYCPHPTYTAETIRSHVEGMVFLHCIVSADGKATNISILRSLSKDLDEAAIKALQEWKFQPATGPDGKPAATSVEIEIDFRLLN